MENYNIIPILLALIFAVGVLATGVIIVVLDAIFNLGLA
tara:strand:+ start:1833 stop:1949 length:117 start_codon:yes stop_codon:yes gene_type:complete